MIYHLEYFSGVLLLSGDAPHTQAQARNATRRFVAWPSATHVLQKLGRISSMNGLRTSAFLFSREAKSLHNGSCRSSFDHESIPSNSRLQNLAVSCASSKTCLTAVSEADTRNVEFRIYLFSHSKQGMSIQDAQISLTFWCIGLSERKINLRATTALCEGAPRMARKLFQCKVRTLQSTRPHARQNTPV